MNWQPIETAPENKRVIVFYPDAGVLTAIDKTKQKIINGKTVVHHKWIPTYAFPTTVMRTPTHWMPLPQPPTTEAP